MRPGAEPSPRFEKVFEHLSNEFERLGIDVELSLKRDEWGLPDTLCLEFATTEQRERFDKYMTSPYFQSFRRIHAQYSENGRSLRAAYLVWDLLEILRQAPKLVTVKAGD
jgi:hypothetical protein